MTAVEAPLLTLEDASARVHVSVKTLRRYIASGRLTGYRVGPSLIRLDPLEVDKLLRPISIRRDEPPVSRPMPPDEPMLPLYDENGTAHFYPPPAHLRWAAAYVAGSSSSRNCTST